MTSVSHARCRFCIHRPCFLNLIICTSECIDERRPSQGSFVRVDDDEHTTWLQYAMRFLQGLKQAVLIESSRSLFRSSLAIRGCDTLLSFRRQLPGEVFRMQEANRGTQPHVAYIG